MKQKTTRQIVRYLSFVILAGLLAETAWTAVRVARSPALCADWAFTNAVVFWSEPDCPVQVGDAILSINHQPISFKTRFFSEQPGDPALVISKHMGKIEENVLQWQSARGWSLFSRLLPVWISFSLIACAFLLTAFASSLHEQSLPPLILLSAFSALTINTFAVTPYTSSFLLLVDQFLLIWLGPLFIDTHRRFLSTPPRWLNHGGLIAMYAFSGLLLLLLIWNIAAEPLMFIFLLLVSVIWLCACWLFTLALLAWGLRHETNVDRRRRLGVMILSNIAAFFPILTISLLPQILYHKDFLPFPFVMLSLLFLPFGYGLASLRYRLVRLNRFINRGLSSFLTIFAVTMVYLLLYQLINGILFVNHLPPGPPNFFTNLVILMALFFLYQPISQGIQHKVNFLLYGEAFDYRSAVHTARRTFERSAAPSDLYQSIPEAVQKILQLDCVWLYIPEDASGLQAIARAASTAHPGTLSNLQANHLARSLRSSPRPQRFELHPMQQWQDALPCEHAQAFLPMFGNRGLTGVLVIGQKLGGAELDESELDILDAVSRQASILLENTQLIIHLNRQVEERRRLYEKNLLAREDERRRLARELHDQVIQQLAGVHYALSNLALNQNVPMQPLQEIQSQIRGLIEDVRTICAGLRPPALDSQGLVAALESIPRLVFKNNGEEDCSPVFTFSVQGDPQQEIPEPIQMTLYRAFQEILQNIQKHAHAAQVHAALNLTPQALMLMIEDDGCGFELPDALDDLTKYHHFGLAGVQERIELIQGEFKIDSQPGEGCRVFIRIPLHPEIITSHSSSEEKNDPQTLDR